MHQSHSASCLDHAKMPPNHQILLAFMLDCSIVQNPPSVPWTTIKYQEKLYGPHEANLWTTRWSMVCHDKFPGRSPRPHLVCCCQTWPAFGLVLDLLLDFLISGLHILDQIEMFSQQVHAYMLTIRLRWHCLCKGHETELHDFLIRLWAFKGLHTSSTLHLFEKAFYFTLKLV